MTVAAGGSTKTAEVVRVVACFYTPQTALVVIDMLNDFVLEGAPLEVPAARGIITHIAGAVARAKQDGAPVVYLCDTHDPDDREFRNWPRHCVRGTQGAEVVQPLRGQETVRVPKTRYSGFFRSDLEAALNRLGVKTLVLSGLLTDICVYFTAADAYMRDYTVAVLKDGVAALSLEDHQWALRQMERLFKAALV